MIWDIFIKTYHGDFCWLDGCLKSIKKFGSGFRNIIIVTEDDGHKLPEELFDIMPLTVHYVPFPDRVPSVVEHGLGYLWQQHIKLTWINYTDADCVIIVDSDEMFRLPFTPESFMTDGKINWWGRTWEEVPQCKAHKPSTDLILQTDTLYETMVFPVFPFHRQTTIDFLEYIYKLHSVDTFWDIIVKYDMASASEYNIYGNYLYISKAPLYNFRFDQHNAFNNHAIRIFWSWGGMLKTEVLEEREKILNLSCE